MPERLRVLIDGRLLRRRRTGVATYIRELQAALEAAGGVEVHLALGPPPLPRRGRATRVGNLVIDLLWLHLLLPLRALMVGADVIHAPVNWAPWWSPRPTVVTVQDVAWERVPDAYPDYFARYARIFTRRSVRRAAAVVTTSHSTAADLRDLYGHPTERVAVIPIGVHGDDQPARSEREPFVLHVGEFEPRKRVPDLIEAHRRYRATAPPRPEPCRLVLVGSGGAEAARVAELSGDGCELAGFLDAAARDDLYRRATLLVMLSRYEGFGLPVAEAMAHGCPVLVARNSSLEEVAGRHAIHVEDTTPEALAATLRDVLADRPQLADLGRLAHADARTRFDWSRVALRMIDVYRGAAR